MPQSSNEIQQDVFYLVKKEILDKLDIILQKVNLQVIQYLKPTHQSVSKDQSLLSCFKFIQLSSFQKEINVLFEYLDRLYSSLNSSISFSSVDIKNSTSGSKKIQNDSILNDKYNTLQTQHNQLKLICKKIKEQNQRLNQQNQQLKAFLAYHSQSIQSGSKTKNFKSSQQSSFTNKNQSVKFPSVVDNNSQKMKTNSSKKQVAVASGALTQSISIQTVRKILRFYNHSIHQVCQQFRQFSKQVSKVIKQQKFKIIQNRVQCIAKLKQFSQKQQQYIYKLNQQNQKSSIVQIKQLKEVKQFQVQQQQKHQSDHFNTDYCVNDCLRSKYFDQSGRNISYMFEEQILGQLQEILDLC